MTQDANTPENLVTQTTPKEPRRYLKSGYFRAHLSPDECEAMDEIFEGILADYPDVAKNTAWTISASTLARQMVLSMRCPPPRTPGDDHGMKVSVSRDKIILAYMHQLGITRQQAKERDPKDDPNAWLAKQGFAPKTVKRANPPHDSIP